MAFKANLLVAENIEFNPVKRMHSVQHVMNMAQVSSFPSAIGTYVLIKLMLPDSDFTDTAHVEVHAPDQVMVVNSPLVEIKNFRPSPAAPGMEAAVNIRFAVTEEGNYIYKLVVNQEVVAEYPLYIHLAG